MANNRDKYNIEYFIAGLERSTGMKASVEMIVSINEEFKEVLIGIGCFIRAFLLQIKEGTKPYQPTPETCGLYHKNCLEMS